MMLRVDTFSDFKAAITARGVACSRAHMSYRYYSDRKEHWLEIFLTLETTRELNLMCRKAGAPLRFEHVLKHAYWVDAPVWTGLMPSCGGILFTRPARTDIRGETRAPVGHISVMRTGRRFYGKIELQRQSYGAPPIDECKYDTAVMLASPVGDQIFCTLLRLAGAALQPSALLPKFSPVEVGKIVDNVLRVYLPLQRNGVDVLRARNIVVDVLSEEGLNVWI